MSRNNQTRDKTPFYQKIALVIFGVFLTVVILEIGLRLGGFILLSIQEHRNSLSISKRGSYRIMCLGESTTAGQYPPFLEEILNQRNIGIKFSVIDKGICGINTEAILSRLESNLDAYHPDMVITMMGINDRGLHLPSQAISDSKAINFLESCRTYKLARLLWLHIVTKLKDLNQPEPPPQGIGLQQALTENKDAPPSEVLLKYNKAIEINPKNDLAYVMLGESYRDQGKFLEAEEPYKKAIELNPKNDRAYVELGCSYREQGKLSEAEELFKKAIELNPKNYDAYIELGGFYREQGKLSEAEELFKKAIELDPKNDLAYLQLGNSYRCQSKLSEAEELFKKALELNPESYWICAALEILYKEMGNLELAREYGKRVKELRLSYYNAITISNYHKLKAILDKRGITYVCVQYPMRSIEPLKQIFQNNAQGIIFVDNENVFKYALKKTSYQEYFTDMFGGDFGHCTDKGNRLLAENIANSILKEVFNK